MRGSFFFRLFFSMWDHNKWSFQLYAKLIVAFIILFVSKLLRLVAEISMERKMKSQKSKTKSSEGKKQQLSSVRVIQRNLVYIVGLPLNLGDEDVLSLSLSLSVCFFPLLPYMFWIRWWQCFAASSAERIFWPVWKGFESVYVPYGGWCYSAISKQYL